MISTERFVKTYECSYCGSAHDTLEAGNKCPSCGAPFEPRVHRYSRTALDLVMRQERLRMIQRQSLLDLAYRSEL